jgi:hypothetical protein
MPLVAQRNKPQSATPARRSRHTSRMPKTHDVVSDDGTTARRKPVVGDMRWDGKLWRRWNGRRWARAAYSLHPERLTNPAPLFQFAPIDESRRQRALALAVEDQVATNAASVILDGPSGVALAYRRPVAHFMHAIITGLTGGLWAIVWIAVAFGRREDRIRLEADRWGNVWAHPIASL